MIDPKANNHASPPPLAGEGQGGGKARWLVSQQSRNRARALRRNLTGAEKALWRELRGHRLNGLAFRRQTPIDPYIADFVSHQAKLDVELDGGHRFQETQNEKDKKRDAFLIRKGFRVLRFSNFDVLQNKAGVLSVITETAVPSLTLPRKRGREKKGTNA